MGGGDLGPDSSQIGKRISNTRVYILNRDMDPVSTGEVGELYTAGDGLARGYLNASDANCGQFLNDPFSDQPRQRMYRTGDLGRWRRDGSIEFRGRVGCQVKILGIRYETGVSERAILRSGQW